MNNYTIRWNAAKSAEHGYNLMVRTSKCGRFQIFTTIRGTKVSYHVKDRQTGREVKPESYLLARQWAEVFKDPNWKPQED